MINKIAQNLAIKIKPYQLKIELILITLIIISILLKNSELGNMLVLFPFNVLAILYFILAFRLSAPENKTAIFLDRLIYISFSVGMIGTLYAIQNYPGAAFMLRISIVTMYIGLIFTFIIKIKNKELQNFIDADTIRIVIFTLVITGLIYFGGFDITGHQDYMRDEKIKTEIRQDSSNIDE